MDRILCPFSDPERVGFVSSEDRFCTRCWPQRSSERVLRSLRPIHGSNEEDAAVDAAAAVERGFSVRLINSGDGATDAAFWCRRCDPGASLKRPNVHALPDPFDSDPLGSVQFIGPHVSLGS